MVKERAMKTKTRSILRPESLPDTDQRMGYSYGIRVGDTIWVSGQVGKNERNELVGGDDVGAQAEQCFRNIAAILAEGGATLDDVVQLNIFLKDASLAPPVQQVRRRTFKDGEWPTAVIVVAEAIRPEYLVEIQAVAVVA
jgi:enamine deaminase RidA (YjgF/YER057c/UK114 family)